MRWFPFLFMSLQQLFNVGALAEGSALGRCRPFLCASEAAAAPVPLPEA